MSALYAEDGANIELTGENKIGTWADNRDSNTLERTVWAYSSDDTIGSSISFDGAVQIGTDSYSSSPNSADVAIAAGTATDLTKNDVVGLPVRNRLRAPFGAGGTGKYRVSLVLGDQSR